MKVHERLDERAPEAGLLDQIASLLAEVTERANEGQDIQHLDTFDGSVEQRNDFLEQLASDLEGEARELRHLSDQVLALSPLDDEEGDDDD